jgi:hypothetical protein
MPTQTRQFPAALLAPLKGKASPAAIAAAVEYLTTQAAARSSPAKSIRAFVRHLEALDGVKPAVAAAILKGALARIPERDAVPGSLAWAAQVTGLSARTLTAKLRTARGRRLYGWPLWRGAGLGWEFDPKAINPDTRGEYLRTLPLDEPEIARSSLPSWCEPEVRSDETAA